MNRRLVDEFGLEVMADLAAKYKGPSVCSATEPNANFICGMAYSLVDLDWNGDVYPCHLSKGPELVLGNLFVEDFDAIFRRVRERGIRVESHEIPKCSHCKFVSTCGGGCRAGAWFAHGSLAREDGLCDLNYNSKLQSILIGASSWYPTAGTNLG
jgi:radical SAM protein with 4Fe4S-binding SPASM domain